MNKAQQFIKDPNENTARELVMAHTQYLVKNTEPPLNTEMVGDDNFWKFLFNSSQHLSFFVEQIKEKDSLHRLFPIEIDNKRPLDYLNEYDPNNYSNEQNIFLYCTDNFDYPNFSEDYSVYFHEKLSDEPEATILIKQFLNKIPSNNYDERNWTHQFAIDFTETYKNLSGMRGAARIMLCLETKKILENLKSIGKFSYKEEFDFLTSCKQLQNIYGSREDFIAMCAGSGPNLCTKSFCYYKLGILHVHLSTKHSEIHRKKIESEKELIERVMAQPAVRKHLSKL